jgi:hypothetical protein
MEWLTKTTEFLYALGFQHFTLVSVVLVLFFPISIVYALGKGLNILKSQLQKNFTAIILVVVISVLEVLSLIPTQVQSTMFLCSIGFFVYVVLWQRFYKRADKKLDTVIGNDEGVDDNGFTSKKRKAK